MMLTFLIIILTYLTCFELTLTVQLSLQFVHEFRLVRDEDQFTDLQYKSGDWLLFGWRLFWWLFSNILQF